MDSPSASSPSNPFLVFTCPEIPQIASSLYGLSEPNRQRKQIDILVKIGDKKYPAHRQVLSSSSPVLETMLSENLDPERKDVIELDEKAVHPIIADDLLDFLYIRKITITMANAELLLKAANYLDIPSLKAGAGQFLADHLQLSSDNVIDFSSTSSNASFSLIPYQTMDSPSASPPTNPSPVNDSFNKLLDAKHLLDLKVFKSNIVNREMFELLVKWIKVDLPTRTDSLLIFLKVFPFHEVSEKFIINTVLKEEIIINSPDCLELVNDAIFINELSSLLKTNHLFYIGKSVYHLDFSTEKWTPMSPMIHERKPFFCSAASGDKIYIFGGGSNTAEVFDTKLDRWTELPPMPVNLRDAAAVALNGYIYVSGGYKGVNEKTPLRSVHCYCVATNKWSSVARMNKTRFSHKMVSFNDSIFAIGGDWDGYNETVEKYSLATNQWEMVPKFDLRQGDLTVLHQGEFYAFNVHEDHLIDNMDTVRVYDPLTNSTETFQASGAGTVLTANAHPKCVSVGNKIWALDYNYDRGIFGEFDPVTRIWKKVNIDMRKPILNLSSRKRKAYYDVVVLSR